MGVRASSPIGYATERQEALPAGSRSLSPHAAIRADLPYKSGVFAYVHEFAHVQGFPNSSSSSSSSSSMQNVGSGATNAMSVCCLVDPLSPTDCRIAPCQTFTPEDIRAAQVFQELDRDQSGRISSLSF